MLLYLDDTDKEIRVKLVMHLLEFMIMTKRKEKRKMKRTRKKRKMINKLKWKYFFLKRVKRILQCLLLPDQRERGQCRHHQPRPTEVKRLARKAVEVRTLGPLDRVLVSLSLSLDSEVEVEALH